MTRAIAALFAVCLAVLSLSAPSIAQAHARAALDTGWRFLKADAKGAEAPDFDDRQWRVATLPHTPNASDGEDGATAGASDYYRGTMWYRKDLDLKALPATKRLYLQFDGAALVSDVFVNGRFVGRHEGGYAIFRFDISRFVTAGRNVVAVRVSNAVWPHIAPPGGDFTLFGGLYRGVSLIETREAGFDWLDNGSPAVAVTPADVSARSADLNIRVGLRNHRGRTARLIVQTRIFDATGKPVLSLSKSVNVAAGGTARAELKGELKTPRLWNGRKDPYLYSAVTEISDDNATLDRSSLAFGIRTVSFDAQKGLLLNGQPYEVNGVNLHASRAGKGGAISRADIAEDFDLIEEMGATAVRLVHYQHAQTAYDEADRRGLLVLTEIPLVGQLPAVTELLRANAAQQLRELIRQNINHPSVIAWGLGNELHGDTATVAGLFRELNTLAKAEDPTRPTIYAHCCVADDEARALVTDQIGFNRYFGWYTEQKGTLGEWADAYHKRFPTRPFALTEYGAGGSLAHQDDTPGVVVPASGWHPESYQSLYHETNWAMLKARPFIWGRFVWQMFDAASDGRNEGEHAGINDKGLVSYDRQTRKDSFWFYKAQWSNAPVVYITSRRLTARTEARTDVKIYTNQPQITLTVNGVKLATQNAVNGVVVFKSVTLSPGVNNLQAENGAYYDRVRWALNPPVESLIPTPAR
ncbi:glycoside hydrolase family 2 protein [Asticcacaulis sp. AND118]|uniref:glycoside hydrolase family 2 protein n=1 Tax=Asticcacaulis sp. AND118 TaxID=2840468 RepID=UPI001CFF70C2|nr:glycoside hydrolase family 2 TIM barrel-domain containing protein [Asticcacaulis sp. AND118]UDF03187.1 beta galactosidase jelly roll domain-containing protein [Asticcacaulis sp. AND118]